MERFTFSNCRKRCAHPLAPSARGLRPQAVGERTVRQSEIFRAMARFSPSAPSGHRSPSGASATSPVSGESVSQREVFRPYTRNRAGMQFFDGLKNSHLRFRVFPDFRWLFLIFADAAPRKNLETIPQRCYNTYCIRWYILFKKAADNPMRWMLP